MLAAALSQGGSLAYRLRSRRCRPGTSPVLSSATQVIAAAIAAVAGMPSRCNAIPAGQNQAGPLHV
jgi:hypothetical protein